MGTAVFAVYPGASESVLHKSSDERTACRLSYRDRPAGRGNVLAADPSVCRTRGGNRTIESKRPDGVGTADEQYQKRGDRGGQSRFDFCMTDAWRRGEIPAAE